MKALSYLLGARAIDTAMSHDDHRRPSEPPFLPIATTPEQASAWRRWAAEGRTPIRSAEPLPRATGAIPQTGRSAARGGSV